MLNMLFLGDIFSECIHNMRPEADYIFGNLESPLGGTVVFPAKRMPNGKRLALKSNPEYIKKLNLSAVSLANNHIWDYGEEGFDETVKYLNEWGWNWIGAGTKKSRMNLKGPATVNVDGANVCLFAYSWHVWPMTSSIYLDGQGAIDIQRKRIEHDIKNNPFKDDCVTVVSLHWGFEREILPMPSQRRLAHDIIEWGADIVVGTHPHVLQGIELYKHGIIMYSLGNFLFKYKNKSNPFPEESIGVHINSDNVHDYKIQIFNGDKRDISRRLNSYNQQLRSSNYRDIWNTKRLRKELPGVAWGVQV